MGKRVEIRELVLDMAKERLERLRKKWGVRAAGEDSGQSAPKQVKRKTRANYEFVASTDGEAQPTKTFHENNAQTAGAEKVVELNECPSEQPHLGQIVTICETDIGGKSSPNGERNGGLRSENTNERDCADQSKQSTKRRNYISVKIDRALRARAGHQCEYIDPETNTRCSERRHLERDHVIEVALGGDDSLENLQLLCSNHNKLKATHQFGFYLMADFMPSLH